MDCSNLSPLSKPNANPTGLTVSTLFAWVLRMIKGLWPARATESERFSRSKKPRTRPGQIEIACLLVNRPHNQEDVSNQTGGIYSKREGGHVRSASFFHQLP